MKAINQSRTFQKGASEEIFYPNKNENIKGVVSPRIGKQHNVPPPPEFGSEQFELSAIEAFAVGEDVRNNVWPEEFLNEHFKEIGWGPGDEFNGLIPAPLLPAGLSHDNPKAAAELVRMDLPSDLGNYIFNWLIGVEMPFNGDIDYLDFLLTRVFFNNVLNAEIYRALEKCFEVKWFYGQPRPEEIAGLPGCFITAYSEGCPQHPAYIAGHATVAGTTMRVVEKFFNFNGRDQEKLVCQQSCYHFAQYRTLALVHWVEDNVEGLKFGYSLRTANHYPHQYNHRI